MLLLSEVAVSLKLPSVSTVEQPSQTIAITANEGEVELAGHPGSGQPLLNHVSETTDQLQRQFMEFIAATSHELRSHLASIKASAEIVVEQLSPREDAFVAQLLLNVVRNVDRLNSLVGDLNDIARLRSAALELEREPTDLRTVVRQSVATVLPIARSRGQEIDLLVGPRELPADVDRRRFEQVLTNLLHNASNYSGVGARIVVRAFRKNHTNVVEVSDNGPGIAEDERDLIFQPFYRGRGPLTRRTQGSGLGLAIAKSLVELHGGMLTVRSTVGRGTTFAVTVPAEPAASTRSVRPAERVAARVIVKRRRRIPENL